MIREHVVRNIQNELLSDDILNRKIIEFQYWIQ